ncbi:hypothetical protein BKI52_29240 [marine bacterium AO1-C]|nr:hypothetical protein BKI52_29240 [marine bacterium AO1-C]
MGKREEKIANILQQTTRLLVQEGVGGLSMRRVADLTEIRLSNLQYYFKDREELLKATVEHYFEQCKTDVLQSLPPSSEAPTTDLEQILRDTLEKGLVIGDTNEQCSMFREIWALSSRNSSIAGLVKEYYYHYCQWLVQLIASYTPHPQLVVSLLLPYVEGYSIMGQSLPLSKDEVISLLIKTVMMVIKE